jgi:hypothetical protein
VTLALKRFANGQLPASKGTIYSVQSDAEVHARVKLTNTANSAIKVNLYTKNSATTGTSRRIIPKDMELLAQATFTSNYEELEGGNLIEGDAGTASFVDYVVSGLRRS